jgi:ribokinase
VATVIVAGSLNLDVTFRVNGFPNPGEDKPVRESWHAIGGKALNQATAAHRAGAAVCLVGAVGDDGFGEEVIGFLREEGIDTRFCEVFPGERTGLALVLLEPDARNTILFEPGAVRRLRWPASIAVRPGDCVLSHAEVPADVLVSAYRAGRRAGAINIMSGMRFNQVDKLLPLIDLLIVNQKEFETLVQQSVPAELLASEDLTAMVSRAGFASANVVVTLGEMGARYLKAGGGSAHIGAAKVDAVDTTAAGDVFTGALSAGLAHGRQLLEAIEFGVRAGSLAVTRRGAASSAPQREEIVSFQGARTMSGEGSEDSENHGSALLRGGLAVAHPGTHRG